ncbi:tRNA-methyltransferase [Endocarpon pusillum Z07020]|uniref:tRNA (guanine-N(7)-)-methyltransferase n=1 Tax=Endocarpon pusillum (strain Z07020 / HMAS-L-300199) TaxID=1263415 RepID=U1HVV1_ENDPU|nr:tRNA-methyltransferase [Endocarpon pusillum Z07020]ERF73504.1 tRNA-methyltransferase [Endocarpon pusillum Z07020]
MDWSTHYPAFVCPDQDMEAGQPRRMSKQVEIADVGCGFGGLLIALSPLFPDTLMIGMELRTQVLSYVTNRILALRSQHQPQPQSQTQQPSTDPSSLPSPSPPSSSFPPGPLQNISALRTNTMKHLPNYFHRHQLSHLFLCFPDPHFKARKHKARIVSAQLNAEYAFVVRPGGCVYTITDVEELAGWIVGHFSGRKVDGEEEGDDGEETVGGNGADKTKGVEELWERVSEQDLQSDPCVEVMREETEEGKKVSRHGGRKFVSVWRRREDPPWPDEVC